MCPAFDHALIREPRARKNIDADEFGPSGGRDPESTDAVIAQNVNPERNILQSPDLSCQDAQEGDGMRRNYVWEERNVPEVFENHRIDASCYE